MSFNAIGSQGAQCFADVIRANTALEKLTLNSSGLGMLYCIVFFILYFLYCIVLYFCIVFCFNKLK